MGETSPSTAMMNDIIIWMSINLLYLLIVLVVIFVSMTLHEIMHGYVSYWLGDNTAKYAGRLSFNPLKHIDPFLTIILPLSLALVGAPVFGGAKPVPFDPTRVKGGEWGVAAVGLAGPLTNFLLAFIVYGLWAILGGNVSGTWTMIAATAVSVNLGFFIFNMIPIPPLDGSRVFYALAPDFMRRFMDTVERYGVIVVLALVLLFSQQIGLLMGGAINLFIGLFGGIFGA